jgi:SAM-dependent methyltransferase
VRVFEDLADRYDLWYETPFGRSAYSLECECLRKALRGFRRGLEVGVGTGRFASALGIRFGLDSSRRMLEKAKARGVVSVLGDARALPFKGNSFDLVLMVATLCFLERPLEALREAGRVLTENGALVIGLILKESPWAEFYRDKGRRGHPIYRVARFYSFREVEDMLRAAGFRPTAVFSTLLEDPQDERPLRTRKVEEGLHPSAGFTCIRAEPL